MAIYGDKKHDSGNEVSLSEVGGKNVPSDQVRELSLDKVGVKLLAGTTRQGNLVVELVQGFEREEHLGSLSIDGEESAAYNTALDALESLILAHASEGIDVTSEAYQNGVQTALDAIANNL